MDAEDSVERSVRSLRSLRSKAIERPIEGTAVEDEEGGKSRDVDKRFFSPSFLVHLSLSPGPSAFFPT